MNPGLFYTTQENDTLDSEEWMDYNRYVEKMISSITTQDIVVELSKYKNTDGKLIAPSKESAR